MSSTTEIIIGSSPISLIEALWLSKQGKEVLIIEGSSRLGGAWKTLNIAPYGEVEIGCHIWDVDQEVTQFLGDYLDLKLAYLSPNPRVYKAGRSIPYDWKHNVFMAKRALKHTIGLKFDRFRKDMGNEGVFRLSFLPSRYPYPLGGSAGMLKTIKEKIESDPKIRVMTDRHVDHLSVDREQVIVKAGEATFTSNSVTLTQYTRIDRIEVDGRIIDQNPDIREFCHLHLMIDDRKSETFSYLRLLTDPFIHRLSDVTHQVDQSEHRIILAGIHAKAFHENSEDAMRDHVMRWLKSRKLISRDASCNAVIANSYVCAFMDASTFKTLRNRDSVKVLKSVNFIHGIKERLPDWKSMVSTS